MPDESTNGHKLDKVMRTKRCEKQTPASMFYGIKEEMQSLVFRTPFSDAHVFPLLHHRRHFSGVLCSFGLSL